MTGLAFEKAAQVSGFLVRAGARSVLLWSPAGLGLRSRFKAFIQRRFPRKAALSVPQSLPISETAAFVSVPDNTDSLKAELLVEANPSCCTDEHRGNLAAGAHALSILEVEDAIRLLKPLAVIDCADSDSTMLAVKNSACHYLAVAVHHGLGRLDEAVFWWREHMRISRMLAKNSGQTINGAEIYHTFWSGHLGHTAMLGIQAKRFLLDDKTKKKRYLLCPPIDNPGNSFLVRKMGRFFTLVDDPALLPYKRDYIEAIAKYFYIDNRLTGTATYYWQFLAEVSRAWEEAGLGPLLTLAAKELEFVLHQRAAMGIPKDAWHVCLHVRAPGYKGHHDDLHAALNGDISTYDLAIDAVTKRGGWIIRVGDPSMPPLEPRANVVDYAHSPIKSPEMDILLSGTARFYIGTSSGPAYVPALYGVPSVITNWFPTGTRPLNSGDIYIPKLHWYEIENEFAPFDESMSQPLGHIHSASQFARYRISLRSNTREELRDVVDEMLDRLDGKAEYSPEDRRLQKYFDSVATYARSFGNAQIGRDFLRKFQNLLPPVAKSG